MTIPADPTTTEKPLGLVTQLFRFTVTGGLSAIVDFGSLLIMTHLIGLPDNIAKAISFVFGTTTAYAINRRWTFNAAPSTKRLIAVWVSYLLTFALQVGLYALVRPLLMDHMSYPAAQTVSFVIAQGAATICNFIIQRWVIFRLI
ncbi:MAG: GtrA family protein [Propionibacteriaceae bacterium]|nr:GtrA family protein [Propionibacteriaceae bacterium]